MPPLHFKPRRGDTPVARIEETNDVPAKSDGSGARCPLRLRSGPGRGATDPRNGRAARRAHAVVPRREVRDVHPLGPVLRGPEGDRLGPRGEPAVGHQQARAAHGRSGLRQLLQGIQSDQLRRRRLGPLREGVGHEVHGADHQAPRWLLAVRLEAHRLRHHGVAVRPRHREAVRGRLPEARPQGGSLLFDARLEPPGLPRRRQRDVRRVVPRPGRGTAVELRQGRCDVVRPRRRPRLGQVEVRRALRDDVPAPAGPAGQ